MQLDNDWKIILRKAWSVRFMLLAALLSGAEAILPFFSLSIPRSTYLPILFILTVAALFSRVVAQKEL